MASGDALFELAPLASTPPASSYATVVVVADASTPNISFVALAFDGAVDEHMDWAVVVPEHYDGGGLTFKFQYAMDGTDADQVEIEIRAKPLADASTVLTADFGIDTQTAVTITDTPSGTANQFNRTATGALSHANAGSPSAGDTLIVRATRDVSVATNTDDLQLLTIYATET